MSDFLNVETSKQATTSGHGEDKDDGFFTTLAALRQVLTPTNTQQQPVVQLLQREKHDLIQELETLRDQAQTQIRVAREAARQAALQHAEKGNQFMERLSQQEERASDRCRELEMDLAHYVQLLAEVRQEKEQAVQQAEDENQRLTDSMIQLERENRILQERCEQVERASHRLQTELNERTTASEQSNIALSKLTKLLQQRESSMAEIQKYKQKVNEALVTASEAQDQLQQAERELSSLKSKMKETEKSQLYLAVHDEDTINKVASLERELVEKTSEFSILQNQSREETASLESQLAARDALLNANEQRLAEFKANMERLEQNEKDLEAKHASEISQIEEEWEETRDELTCAEAEVLRGRTRIQELESRVGQSKTPPEGLDKKNMVVVAPLKVLVADTKKVQRKAKQLDSVEPPPGESQATVQKRKAEEHKDADAPEDLDSIKAKLVAKRRRSQRTKS